MRTTPFIKSVLRSASCVLKKIVFYFLRFLAQRRLARGSHIVIGVTGSIGKTTTKDAVAHVLSKHYKVLKSAKSYNTDIGLPMTILEVESPGRSLSGWIRVLIRSFQNAFYKKFRYDFLVLEMGVDKPGDMDRLLSVVHPNIGIFTGVAPVHMADGQFSDLDEIYTEKMKMILALPSDGLAFFNAENEYLREKNLYGTVQRGGSDEVDEAVRVFQGFPGSFAKIIWYGRDAKLSVSHVDSSWDGISFDLHYGDVHGHFTVPVLGQYHAALLLPAIGCALTHGLSIHDIIQSFHDFHLPPGRMNFLPGVRDSRLLDSSYNASPEAVKMALHTLSELGKNQRKIFVFGTMNELGKISEKSHLKIAEYIHGQVDILITVGDMAQKTADAVLEKKYLEEKFVHSFADVMTAREFVKGILQKDDVVLIKGSQNNVRLEKLVKYIMAEPERAGDLLVRQESVWS